MMEQLQAFLIHQRKTDNPADGLDSAVEERQPRAAFTVGQIQCTPELYRLNVGTRQDTASEIEPTKTARGTAAARDAASSARPD